MNNSDCNTDTLDALIDWMMGDEGETVGTHVVQSFSKAMRMIPFPTEYVGRLKKSGIFAGRTRSLLEE